jgi:hypothetical protein
LALAPIHLLLREVALVPRSPTYDPPTLDEFRAIVARTLRDESGTVFGPDALNDFVSEGLMSLSGYRPIEAIEVVGYDPPTYGAIQYVAPAILSSVWQVTVTNEADPVAVNQALIVPYVGPDQSGVQVGWDFYSGALHFGRWGANQMDAWTAQVNGPLSIVMWGYRDRNLPVAPDEVLDIEDVVDQLCLLRECRALGFQLLANDRALYQQWLAATNNTDVSPTQLNGMLSSAIGDVERQRKRSAIFRRTPVVGPQYA